MNTILTALLTGIDTHLPEPYSSLLKGITYGVPITIDSALKKSIVQTGLAHLIVLSGANITLLTELTGSFCNRLGKKRGIVLNFLFLLLFICIVGFDAPLARATFMYTLALICTLTGRPVYKWWNLFLTILITAIIQPRWTSSYSFQLSVLATVGIFVWGSIKGYFYISNNRFLMIFFESWIVLLFTAPISWLVFNNISLVGPLSTACVSVTIIPLMIGGFVISISHILFPPLAAIASIPVYALLYYVVEVIHLVQKIPYGYIKVQ